MATAFSAASWWHRQSLLMKIIVINVAVFLVLRLLGIIALIGSLDIGVVIDRLAVPPHPAMLLHRPWTAFTYMFTHYDVFHILFNMLALYWFGRILLLRCTPRQLTALYIYCGLGGALLFTAAAPVFPAVASAPLIGASASVMGILIALAILMPDFEVQLLLIGRIRLKWLAVGALVLFALGLAGNNAGGHIAHLGGMIAGAAFALCLINGIDITRPFNRLIDRLCNFFRKPANFRFRLRKKKARFSRSNGPKPKRRPVTEKDLDAILDKIKQSGYASLTPDERARLFDFSNNSNNKHR